MPRIKIMEQDQSYEGPQPQIYRRYTQNTKKKLERMVIGEGMKTSSAAKLLKVKNSSAKMILKKIRNELAKQERKSDQNKQEAEIKVEENEEKQGGVVQSDVNGEGGLAVWWIYYPVCFFDFTVQSKQIE